MKSKKLLGLGLTLFVLVVVVAFARHRGGVPSGATITTSSLPSANQYATSYSQSVAASGVTCPCTWSILTQSGYNPSTWQISGTTATATLTNAMAMLLNVETNNLQIQVQDSLSHIAQRTIPLTTNRAVPAGAAALGYNTLIWTDNPLLSEISFASYGSTITTKWQAGWPYLSTLPPAGLFSMNAQGVLELTNTGGATGQGPATYRPVASAVQLSNGSNVPIPSAAPVWTVGNGWCAAYGIQVITPNSGSWITGFQFPTQHNIAGTQQVDPFDGMVRYGEFDTWEGSGSNSQTSGYGGAAVYWAGASNPGTAYRNVNPTPPELDVTLEHEYTQCYNPGTQTSTWYADNVQTGSVTYDSASSTALTVEQQAWLNAQTDFALIAAWNNTTAGYSGLFYYVTIYGPSLSITTTSPLTGATVGTAYTSGSPLQTMAATGGTPSYTWTLAGQTSATNTWTITSGGAITGTPSTAETDTLYIKVADSTGVTVGPFAYTVTVSSTGLFLPAANNVSTNWQNAGMAVAGGYPSRTTVCATVNPSGAIPTGTGGTDVTNIQNAVNSCATGDVLMLGAGSTSSAVVSLAAGSNTMTVISGTVPQGAAILDANGKLYPGEIATTSCSGGTCTVAMPPVYGQSLSSETVTIATQFNFWTNDQITVNKDITIRGTGTCNVGNTFQAVCPTILNVYNGALPDWALSTAAVTAGDCGITTSSYAYCNVVGAFFFLGPGQYNEGWGGCSVDNANPTTSNCGTTLTADAAQGVTQINVTSISNFSIGQWVLIDEDPQVTTQASPMGLDSSVGSSNVSASPDWLNTTATTATMRLEGGDEAGNYSFIGAGSSNRANQEIHRISNIGTGCGGGATALTICFDDPLTLAFRQSGSHDARLYWPTVSGSVSNFTGTAATGGPAVENLSMTRTIGNGGGITIEFCAYCWIKDVEVGGWIHGAFDLTNTARDLVDTCYTHLGYNLTNNGTEYSIAIDERATETEVTNCIDVWGGKGMVGRASNTAVVSYNYIDQTYYESIPGNIGDYWQELGANGSHYAGTHHWLFEGNWTINCDADNTHGNATYHFYFRNNCTGLRSNFTDVSVNKAVSDASGTGWVGSGTWPSVSANGPGLLRAAGPNGFNYWFAFADNVLGTAGQTTSGNGWAYQVNGNIGPGQSNKGIWAAGWGGGQFAHTDANLNPNIGGGPFFIFKNGNYDYVNASIVDNAGGYLQSFPNSFYLSSAPPAFSAGTCTYPWPWVTPTNGTKLQTNSCSGSGLPAKARWDAGTPFTQP